MFQLVIGLVSEVPWVWEEDLKEIRLMVYAINR